MGRGPCEQKSTWLQPNINLRDPVMYRILHAHHHRTGRHLVHLSYVRLGARPE